jgi:hypothetical protein
MEFPGSETFRIGVFSMGLRFGPGDSDFRNFGLFGLAKDFLEARGEISWSSPFDLLLRNFRDQDFFFPEPSILPGLSKFFAELSKEDSGVKLLLSSAPETSTVTPDSVLKKK